jgi:hypothetical protein
LVQEVSLSYVSHPARADMSDFDAARRMIRRFETEYDLSDSLLEEVALATSRELYDNAETGNIHTGDMKLAYDW